MQHIEKILVRAVSVRFHVIHHTGQKPRSRIDLEWPQRLALCFPRPIQRAIRFLLHAQKSRRPAQTFSEVLERPVNTNRTKRRADCRRNPIEYQFSQHMLKEKKAPESRCLVPPARLRDMLQIE